MFSRRILDNDEHDDTEECSRNQDQERSALPDISQKMEFLLDVLHTNPSGPIYQSTHKQLAELVLQSDNEQEAVYHLSESHATTLRHQACSYLTRNIRKGNEDSAKMKNMKERLSFEGVWHGGVNGLHKRISELPCEWTVVQLTMEYDPLSRFPPRNRKVNRGLGVYITRFPCGSSSKEISSFGCGWKPITVFLPALDRNMEQLSLTAAMQMHLDNMNRREKGANRSKKHDECSLGIEATTAEIETWLSGWCCLLLGRLVDKELSQEIKSAVDSCVSSVSARHLGSPETSEDMPLNVKKEVMKNIPSRSLNILYLCASLPSITRGQIFQVSLSLFEDAEFAKLLSKEICDIRCNFMARVLLSKRHPVILVVDEDLDILPFEMMTYLQDHPVTRMPSIHFLQALYCYHKDTTIKNGVNVKNGYYVVNPSKNLPRLENMFSSLISCTVMKQWKGVYNEPPSQDEFLKGLVGSDMFLYCGHGNGSQFISRDCIERAQIKAVVILLGCASSTMNELGGRVEMTSISNSYLMALSPCIVGMLWSVLDEDVNAMTEKLLEVLSSSENASSTRFNEIDSLHKDFLALGLTKSKDEETTRDLCSAVSVARKAAVRFLNKAAIVVRGLPLPVTL